MVILIKILIVMVFCFFWFLTQRWIGKNQTSKNLQIQDALHQATDFLHKWVLKSSLRARFLLASSSLIIDLLGLYLIFLSIWGATFQPMIALILVFSLRQVNQFMTQMPAPQNMIWYDPKLLPSIFVTYGVSNDLFFSGHTALAVLGALQIVGQTNSSLAIALAAIIILYEIIIVIALRAHWTMDVYTGVVTAVLGHILANFLSPWVDSSLITIGSFLSGH